MPVVQFMLYVGNSAFSVRIKQKNKNGWEGNLGGQEEVRQLVEPKLREEVDDDDDGDDNDGGGGKTFNILWNFVPALFKAVGMYSFS